MGNSKCQTGDTMLYVDWSKTSFRCDCGCNVFKKTEETAESAKYKCNGCGEAYVGERR
jgi:predicted RNA-binding Zn-ribbon protein involved in translation (DUF1610 family)